MHRHELRLNALRAFEVAARLGSLSAAAKELHVTHSAIRHHVKALEEQLGIALFYHAGRHIRCTQAGQQLAAGLCPAFDQIAEAVKSAKAHTNRNNLAVTLTPAFATKWLVPRLGRFHTRHPDIKVHLQPTLDLVDFRHRSLDLGIRTGTGPWPGLKAVELMQVHMTPMCSPSFLSGPHSLSDPSNLCRHTLIHADVQNVGRPGTEWQTWLDAAGISDVDTSLGDTFEDPSLALQAAINGQGVALTYCELAQADVEMGRLVMPFKLKVKHPWSYFLVGLNESFANPIASEFQHWLEDEIRSMTSA